MGLEEYDYFFEVSRLHRGIAMLDERIAAASWQEPHHVENDDKLGEIDTVSGPLNLKKLTRILSAGQVSLASMRAFRESLVRKLNEAYRMFADQELESLSNLREESTLGGLAEQCAFAISVVLDSFVNQFEENVERMNSTVDYFLEFSEELGLPVQAKSGPEPFSGSGVVRLSGQNGEPCNGVRVGNDELRTVDEAQAVTKFISQITVVADDIVRKSSSSERSSVVEHEIFLVSEEREYAYGEAVFPSRAGDTQK